MNTLARFSLIFSPLLAAAALEAGTAGVVVKPADFEQFRDLAAPLEDKAAMWSGFVEELTEGLQSELERVVPGGVLELSFTEFDRAGEVQPWRNRHHSDIRYFEQLYFPHATFAFALKTADGTLLASGRAHVRDMEFFSNLNPLRHSSEFFFEVEMLRRWVSGELRRVLVQVRPLRAVPAMRTA